MPRRPPRKKGRKDWDPREEVQRFAEEKVRTESAQEFAREATRRPRDFAYWGDLPIGETWGYVITRSRDADLLEESNYETIKGDLEERFPDDVREERASHWAVGWVDQLAIRLLDEDGKATRAADAAYEWQRALEDYPVADEEDHSRREYEATIENIKSEGGIDEDLAGEVFSWLWDNDQEAVAPRDGGGGYPSEEQIHKALWAIGKPTAEMIEERNEEEKQMTPEEREVARRREYRDPPEQQKLFGRKSWDPRGGKRKYRVSDIEWETDDEEVELPSEVTLELPEAVPEDEIGYLLADRYGRLVSSFMVTRLGGKMSGRKAWDPRKPKRKELRAPYDDRLPSMPPFMWVERHDRVGPLGVLAFGAFNAMGLIGSEKGGVAVVYEDPPEIIATKDVPWDPVKRDREAAEILKLLEGYGPYNEISVEQRQELLGELRGRGYGVRWLS